MIEQWENRASAIDFDKLKERYEKQLAKWQENRMAGKAKRRRPRPPVEPDKDQNGPSALYNGMIAPLVPYAIKGAIWYQGERNSITAETSYAYRQLLSTMITNWREDWGQGDFPFLFVQLPNFQTDRSWPLIRESMLKTLQLPQTGMAVTIDIGEARKIHPKNKQDVGKRLAMAALGVAYNKEIVYSGPIYESMIVNGKKITLTFKHIGGGLIAKGEKLEGFTVAGENRNFVAAEAKIKNNVVIVTSETIDKPVAVRYAWENNPLCNLYNKELLPASPFRTDAW